MKYLLPDGSQHESTTAYRVHGVGITLIGFDFDGAMQWYPESLLTPVPTTPTEPPPGAYQIGEHSCWHEEAYGWRIDFAANSIWRDDWHQWPDVLAMIGGPDVTIQRLVPALPTVNLPWHFDDPSDDSTVEVTKRGNVRICGEIVSLTTAGRREMAAALLSYDAAAGEP